VLRVLEDFLAVGAGELHVFEGLFYVAVEFVGGEVEGVLAAAGGAF